MKQKTRLKILEISIVGIGYRPMNGRYIGIGSQKSHIGRSLIETIVEKHERLLGIISKSVLI